MASNPLTILGLAPEALRGRSEAEVAVLVREFGRTLSKVYHTQTEITGNATRFQEVRDALRTLSDRQALRTHLNSLLAPSKTRVAKAEAEAEKLRRSLARMRKQQRAYLKAASRTTEGPTIVDLKGQRVNVFDYVRHECEGGSARYRNALQAAKLFLTYIQDEKGNLFEVRHGKTKPVVRRLIGCIPFDPRTNMKSQVLGLIAQARQPTGRSELTGPGARSNHKPRVLCNRIPLNRANGLLDLLVPEVSLDALLFSIAPAEDGHELYFEGVISQERNTGA